MHPTFSTTLCNIIIVKGFLCNPRHLKETFFSFFSPSAQEAQTFDHVHTFPQGCCKLQEDEMVLSFVAASVANPFLAKKMSGKISEMSG